MENVTKEMWYGGQKALRDQIKSLEKKLNIIEQAQTEITVILKEIIKHLK